MTSNLLPAGEDISQNEIRELVKQGKLWSLESIMELYPQQQYGELLDLEVERENGAIVYELKFLQADGRIVELEIDASNGDLLEQEFEN
ncbi:MAG: peptidase M4 [Gammaproteobacteria bacterium]|nr:peptidase M4 [Gammaproteobacteria bacterium]